MNKKLGLAVAGALVAFSSVANAGITIPAGDWTVDIGGNVNAYYTHKSTDVSAQSEGSSVSVPNGYLANQVDGQTIGTGLLPAAFGIGAKTRQNDLDIAFQFSFFTGTSSGATGAAAGNNTLNIRQAFLTFGDASWGTIKAGRDLGIYASDAILSDMTLLGVGGSPAGAQTATAGGSSSLGRIGTGYIYADWKGQISYSSPNWNGFQFVVGAMEGFANGAQDLGYEGKVTYDFSANDVTGRVWASGITQKTTGASSYTSQGLDIGTKLAYQGFGLVAYYYDGEGLDSQLGTLGSGPVFNPVVAGLFNATGIKTKDSGGYVQATFVVPTIGTKLGASYGESNSSYQGTELTSESWIVGAYHPLTKSLNLVAEYTRQDNKGRTNDYLYSASGKIESDTVSLGAILFF
jgi:predicted porin